jgi:hypothetical protein
MSIRRLASVSLALSFAAAPAHAHVQLGAPLQRNEEQKSGPCGLAGGTRSDNVCEFQPGATITVQWDETIEHPGHFRLSFDSDGVDDFADPTGYDDRYTAPSVLVDGIPDRNVQADGNPTYSQSVTLPDVECDNCTLQLIQVMSDKMPWGPDGGSDIYYQCADLVLSQSAPAEPAPGCAPAAGGADAAPAGADAAPAGADAAPSAGDAGTSRDSGDGGGGCSAAGASAADASAAPGSALLALLVLLALAAPRALTAARARRAGAARPR